MRLDYKKKERVLKNLFVPLTKDSFFDFFRGKSFELRRAERQWNEKQIISCRMVTLSCGYSGRRIIGVINKVIFGSLSKIFQVVPWQKIEPRAKNKKEAIRANKKLLGNANRYVAFEIIFHA